MSPTAIGIGWLLLGATPEPLAVVGGALCVVGVVVARSRLRLCPALRGARGRGAG